jgi:hypothetical protein
VAPYQALRQAFIRLLHVGELHYASVGPTARAVPATAASARHVAAADRSLRAHRRPVMRGHRARETEHDEHPPARSPQRRANAHRAHSPRPPMPPIIIHIIAPIISMHGSANNR